MAKPNIRKNFSRFANHLDRRIIATKPHKHLIIEVLLKSYPDPLTKEVISTHLRNSLNADEQSEHINAWSQLTNKDKLIIETLDGFLLNIESITDRQKRRLLKICEKRISNVESDFKHKTQIKLKHPYENEPKYASGEDMKTNLIKTSYYLIQLSSNTVKYGSTITLDEIENYNPNLTRRMMEEKKISDNHKNFAILYDKNEEKIRVWGRAEMVVNLEIRPIRSSLIFREFKPIFPIKENRVVALTWISQYENGSIFGNDKITLIDKIDFDRILYRVDHQRKLYQTAEKETVTQPTETNADIQDSPLEQKPVEYEEQIKVKDEYLKIPSKVALVEGIAQIKKDLLIDEKTIEEIVIHLSSGRHILLAGPIGTGKTRIAEMIPKLFWNKGKKGYDSKVYTASYEWNVNDVIGGIVPRMKEGKPIYQIQYGCVTDTVKKSWDDRNDSNNSAEQYSGTWLVIDEFNRAEIDKAFGQLFTSLESKILQIPDEKRPILKEMQIPKDYRIIGTLNTTDKHYLFKLSDALKRRFAYVEVKSPSRKYAEQEMYYALLNAQKELPPNTSPLVSLDTEKRRLSENQPNMELVSAIKSGYEILSFIRMIKDMGTAILKSIYQTLLIGTQIKGYDDRILDIALSANIIPQLEKIDITNIEILMAFCFDDLDEFFHKINKEKEETREKYADGFENYLRFLEIGNVVELKKGFKNGNISDNDRNLISNRWNAQKSKNSSIKKLPTFKTALEELKKTFEFL